MAKRLSLLGILLGIVMGCASTSTTLPPVDLTEAVRGHDPVQGPGKVFETIDEAAIDGLAWCYLNSRGEQPQRIRGGSVRPVPSGGYTYEEVVTAQRFTPDRIQVRVMPTDVGYFIHVPGPEQLSNETHSRAHRKNVDKRDPLHRPSYILTPRLRVQLYEGDGDERRVAIMDRGELRDLVRRVEQD